MKYLNYLTLFVVFLFPVFSHAAEPVPWGLGFQEAASPVKERMVSFHNDLLLPIITGITVFVLLLLIIVVVRFNRHANKTPSKTTHNVPLEIVWTIVPVIILVVIAVPSFKLLYYTDKTPGEPEMTLKVSGFQWAWGYEYPDYGIERFNSYMIPDDEIDYAAGQKRLLSVDNPIILPTETDIQVIVTADDVLHSFAVPSFGLKKDAIPGRLNETWVRITKPGTYYGQCSELCGKGHAYMPSEIIAVEKPVFETWAQIARDDLEASYTYIKTRELPEGFVLEQPEEPEKTGEELEVSKNTKE